MKRIAIFTRNLLMCLALFAFIGCSRTMEDVASWKQKENIPKLIKALGDPKMNVRQGAAEALGDLKAEAAVSALAACYNDENEAVVLAAVDALAAIGTPTTITPLIAALKLDATAAKLTAAQQLGELKATGAIPTLCEILDDFDQEIQMASIQSLEKIGDPSASEALSSKLTDSSDELREAVARALGTTGGEDAAKGLISALADRSDSVINIARDSIIKINKSAIPFLLSSLTDTDDRIRANVIYCLDQLNAVPTEGESFTWYQLANTTIHSTETDTDVVDALAAQGNSSIKTLLEAVAHANPTIREHAILALEEIGKPAAEIAVATAESELYGDAKEWFSSRSKWNGAPAWQIDLWAATAARNPEFSLDSATVTSLEMQARAAFNIIEKEFTLTRAYAPLVIQLLGDTTTPPPQQPDYDAEGMPIIKKRLDDFVGTTNQMLAKKILDAAGTSISLPLIAAINDENERIAKHCAEIVGNHGDKRATEILLAIIDRKIGEGLHLSNSPFYIALQQMDATEAESSLLKIRPNPDRAMRVFARAYQIQPMSSETKDALEASDEPVTFRLGYIKNGRVQAFMITFALNAEGNWIPTPALPPKLP